MPYDSNGVWSLTPGYLAVTGQVVAPLNHNPPLEDISANGLSAVMVRDGRAPATGNWSMGNFKLTNLANGTSPNDAVNFSQLSAATADTRGSLYGLKLSNNVTDATNDIDIATGSASADNISPYPVMTLNSILTKRLDASWAVGSGQGGLDTGAIADNTYHMYLIQRSDTGVVDACFSTSATAPTIGGSIPAAYDRWRRVGSIIRISSAILLFSQIGDRFTLTTLRTMRNSTSGVVDALVSCASPVGIRTRPIFNSSLGMNTASAGENLVGDGDLANANVRIQSVNSAGIDTTVIDQFYTNTSAQIRFTASASAGTFTSNVQSGAGWWDDRGRT